MFDKRLLALLGKDKKYVFAIVFCNLLTTVCNVVITFSICRAVNLLVLGEMSLNAYGEIFAAAVGGVLIRFALALFNGNFSAKLGSNAKEMLRRRIYEKVARLGVRETDDLSLASLTQVGIEGVEQLDLYYSSYLPQLFYSVLSPLILFILFMFISIPTAVILLVCVPMIPMSIIAVSRYAKKIFAKYWGQYTKMGDAFLDNISGMKELKIFAADARYHEKMNGEAEEFRKITMKVLTMQLASTTIMDLVAYGGAGLGIALAVFTHSHINPLFQMSQPVLLLFIVLTAVDFFLPLRALGSAFHVSMNGATAGKKILALLDIPEGEWGHDSPASYDIAMDNVDFSYTEERPILKNVSLEAKPGEFVGIVGLSGSGKSTILSLLSGVRPVSGGTIRIGGKELHTLSREELYKHMGVVSYNTYLFCDTIRNNFKMAKSDITDSEILQKIRQVDLQDWYTTEGGPDLVLQESAVNLSGGQRQRLALAVALSSDKEIYLFDEMTSNIDAESEAIILSNIRRISKTKTVIMVSHRLKNFEEADQIYVLDHGTIAEFGSHHELLMKDGLYASMYRKQKSMEEGYLENE